MFLLGFFVATGTRIRRKSVLKNHHNLHELISGAFQ